LGGENIRFVLAATVVGAKPAFTSANDQIGSLKNGSVSSVELVESAIARIERSDRPWPALTRARPNPCYCLVESRRLTWPKNHQFS
jgi:Asp-tRNA(Asn)/Glu-tRNA(Gln) amidotransferase A subunit family amidase